MPTFKIGEMFRARGFIIVTTNSFLTTEVKVVMGRGAAWQLKRKKPGIEKTFGKMILDTCGHLGRYGLIFHGNYGAAQVKYHFMEMADLDLIEFSMIKLSQEAKRDRKTIFNINYPGIGNGRLKESEVKPALRMLPDNVHVWKKRKVM